jgi:RNA-directed DNA polymerase
MMHGSGKSDSPVVSAKSPNKARKGTEGMEKRGLTKENLRQQNALRTQGRFSVHSALERVRQLAKKEKKRRFTTLFHHVYAVNTLRLAYFKLKKNAAAGVDGQTWTDYGEALEDNLKELSQRLKRGAYQAKPVRRVYIPKADGQQRPLGVTSLEDKIVQRATVMVLNAIYETDFLGFSYGSRPGREPHDALNALYVGLETKRMSWVLDADIRGFFNAIKHEWMVKFLEHRIADKRIVRLIQKWLNAGVLEDGTVTWSDEGAPQGGSASPLLANLYMHYVFDLWVQQWRQRHGHGDIIAVRYVDDTIVGFESKYDADRFLAELRERFLKFGLELHPEKTRLLEFGRFAAERRKRRGERKPETFDFLGFTHICGRHRGGKYMVLRHTIRKRLRAKLLAMKLELKRRRHLPVPEQGEWLRSVIGGHVNYYGVPTNIRALATFRYQLARHWRRALIQRSQKGHVTWKRMYRLMDRWLPTPRIVRPFPRTELLVSIRGRSRMR